MNEWNGIYGEGREEMVEQVSTEGTVGTRGGTVMMTMGKESGGRIKRVD
jgi:hypothetical protein